MPQAEWVRRKSSTVRETNAGNRLLNGLPGVVGVERVELLSEIDSVVTQIGLVGDAILIDENSHYAGFVIFGWVSNKGKSAGHVAVDDVIFSRNCFRSKSVGTNISDYPKRKYYLSEIGKNPDFTFI
jgi:hypothetical protein